MSNLENNTTELEELLNIANSLPVAVRSDWAQTDSTQLDYIKNKPIFNITVNQDTGKIEQSVEDIVSAAQEGKILFCIGALSIFADMHIENGVYDWVELTLLVPPNMVMPIKIYADGTPEMKNSDNMQMKSDRVNSISEESTDEQYPTAKAVYEALQNVGDGGNVSSVNGKIGEVVLNAEDVGALPDNTVIPEIPQNVSAFDNDVGYLTEHQSLESYPTKTEVAADLKKKQDVLEKYTESVNGYSGNVILSAADVKALPDDTDIPEIPENISAFRNDIGYLTKHQSLEDYAKKEDVNKALDGKQDVLEQFVESVNGYSGEVTLSASDVKALPDSTVIPTVPTKISAFTNDADYATRSYVSEILGGKCTAYTFGTITDLDAFLEDAENVAKLNTGDLLYIRDVGVPDYWWDGETQNKQILETTKVDLTDYAKTADIPTKTSQLTNDSGFATEASVDTKLGTKQDKLTSYVETVNGKSGKVTLNASDVGALPSTTFIPPSYEPFYIDCTINQNGGVFEAVATSDTPTQTEVDAAFAAGRPIYLRGANAGMYVQCLARVYAEGVGSVYNFVTIVNEAISTMQFMNGGFYNTSFIAQEKIAVVSDESAVEEGKITIVV